MATYEVSQWFGDRDPEHRGEQALYIGADATEAARAWWRRALSNGWHCAIDRDGQPIMEDDLYDRPNISIASVAARLPVVHAGWDL